MAFCCIPWASCGRQAVGFHLSFEWDSKPLFVGSPRRLAVDQKLGTRLQVRELGCSTGPSSIQTSTSYLANQGYDFMTGSSGPYDIDWVNLESSPNVNTPGSPSFAGLSFPDFGRRRWNLG